MKKRRMKNMCYKYGLLTMLGLTRAFSRADYHLPTKWYSIFDSLRVSSSVLHDRISWMDEEIEEEFRHKEDMIDRHLGNKKFYDDDEVEKLQSKIEDMKV